MMVITQSRIFEDKVTHLIYIIDSVRGRLKQPVCVIDVGPIVGPHQEEAERQGMIILRDLE